MVSEQASAFDRFIGFRNDRFPLRFGWCIDIDCYNAMFGRSVIGFEVEAFSVVAQKLPIGGKVGDQFNDI